MWTYVSISPGVEELGHMVGIYLTLFFKQFFNRKYPSVFQSDSAIYIPAIRGS